MKIDPTEKQSGVISPKTVQPASEAEKRSDFARVLGQTVQSAASKKVQDTTSVHALSGPEMRVDPAGFSTEYQTANGLLDTLEDYQQRLQDPMSSLKTVEPYVRQMKEMIDRTDSAVNGMPDAHPAKSVAQSTLVEMAKEIERFELGYYADD